MTANNFIIQDLSASIDKKNFHLEYQPQFNSKSEFIGIESLARWINSNGDSVRPDIFIPILEDNDLIYDFGLQMAEKAFIFSNTMENSLNIDFKKMAINVSPKQLNNESFVTELDYLRNYNNLSRSKITLEITESESVSDTGIGCIKELSDLGYNISIDDFGTGYASFQYLMTIPLNFLKLDRSFISNIHGNETQQNIVIAIIEMCKKMNIPVIAEGVESIDELKFLSTHGCHNYQGFYFSKPLDEKNLIKIAA